MNKNDSKHNDFVCSKCGSCCMHLTLFHGVYDELDRGDGVCMHFDEKALLCSIYSSRPTICRVEEGYQFFSSSIAWDEYITKMKSACLYLQNVDKNNITL